MTQSLRRYAWSMSRLPSVSALFVLLAIAAPALAQDTEVPYWASIRAEVVNMRVGPGTTYRIDWVYRRTFLPMKVVRRDAGWRLVEDPDGTQGWLLARFLSRDRTAIVTGKGPDEMRPAEMRKEADGKAPLLWRLKPGVVAKLRSCESGWCNIELKGHRGFVREDRLWGPGEP